MARACAQAHTGRGRIGFSEEAVRPPFRVCFLRSLPCPREDVSETNQEASERLLLDVPPYYFLVNADPRLFLVTLSKTNSAALSTDDEWGLILKLTVSGWGPREAERASEGFCSDGCSVLDGSNLTQASFGGQ